MQLLLLPEAVDDYVGPENPVHFVEAFVDELDLAAMGFTRTAAKATGRPGYHPADLLKLYIYGYLNRVRRRRLVCGILLHGVAFLSGFDTPSLQAQGRQRRSSYSTFQGTSPTIILES